MDSLVFVVNNFLVTVLVSVIHALLSLLPWFALRILVNLFLLWLRAVFDTSICMVSLLNWHLYCIDCIEGYSESYELHCEHNTWYILWVEVIQSLKHLQVLRHTVLVKSLDTPSHSRVFLYFYYFLHCILIVKTSQLGNSTYGIM